MNIQVKYHHPELIPIEKTERGDWIDLRSAANVKMKAGEFKLIPLGVSMKLPEGYEANVVPRSSTFKHWGILQTNHYGVIDSTYCGDNDQWFFPAYATRDTTIHFNDRICQFRLNKVMDPVEITEVSYLDSPDRGGHGSSGMN